MAIKLGMIMDDLHQIIVHHDSSFAIMLEAERRGWEIYYFQQKDLFLEQERVLGLGQRIKVFDHSSHWFEVQAEVVIPLNRLDIIFMRKDPPVDEAYLYTTQILSQVEKEGVLVVNRPNSLSSFNEKLLIHQFPQCIPPTLISAHSDQIKRFIAEQEIVICKPLNGMGGRSIFRLEQNDLNTNVVIETLTDGGMLPIVIQKFIPEIGKGDKRVLLIQGQPIPYALVRVPRSGENRANMAAGGEISGAPLSERDYWICQQIGPFLREQGLAFVGIDIIGSWLTEINFTSPTGIRELDRMYALNIAGELFESLSKLSQG